MSAKPLRVVVATTIPRTMEAFYREKIAEFKARGCEVHAITSPGPEVETLRELVDQLHVVPMARDIDIQGDVRALASWVRLLRQLHPDVVFAGTPKAGLLGMTSAAVCRVPRRVYFLQGLRLEGADGAKQRVLATMERLASRSSRKVIAVSDSLAREFRQRRLNAGRPVVVAHHGSSHGVDSDYFTPTAGDAALADQVGLAPGLPVVVFIGRLTRDKGPDAMIEALHILQGRGQLVQLLVVGAQDEPDSQEYLRRLRTSDQPITVIDQVPDVRPYLSLSDVLLLPTMREGMPNVVLEAAAMGIPAVTTTATGAIDSVIGGETGLFFDYGDAAGLADALGTLIADPDLRSRMGGAARERVVRDFQPTDVAREIVSLALA